MWNDQQVPSFLTTKSELLNVAKLVRQCVAPRILQSVPELAEAGRFQNSSSSLADNAITHKGFPFPEAKTVAALNESGGSERTANSRFDGRTSMRIGIRSSPKVSLAEASSPFAPGGIHPVNAPSWRQI